MALFGAAFPSAFNQARPDGPAHRRTTLSFQQFSSRAANAPAASFRCRANISPGASRPVAGGHPSPIQTGGSTVPDSAAGAGLGGSPSPHYITK
jgi:hypothetical protein